jgi:hypothetical protein
MIFSFPVFHFDSFRFSLVHAHHLFLQCSSKISPRNHVKFKFVYEISEVISKFGRMERRCGTQEVTFFSYFDIVAEFDIRSQLPPEGKGTPRNLLLTSAAAYWRRENRGDHKCTHTQSRFPLPIPSLPLPHSLYPVLISIGYGESGRVH